MIFDDAPKIIYDYMAYLSSGKGASLRTLDGYYRDISLFFKFYMKKCDEKLRNVDVDEIDISGLTEDMVKNVTLEDGTSFMLFCQQQRGNNERTRARKATSLRMYFRYLTNRKFLFSKNPFDELELPKPKKSLPKHLSLEQSKRLLDSVGGEFKERDYCIITLFLNCGMRLSELCSMNLTDINYDDKSVIITGKGNKERIVYLNDACIDAIKAYVKVRPKDGLKDRQALFISKQGNRLSRRMTEQVVSNMLARAGLSGQGFSTHKLRHTAATLMYQYGKVDIRVLKEVLGHEDLGTTQIYTHVSNDMVRRASEKNPLSDNKPKK